MTVMVSVLAKSFPAGPERETQFMLAHSLVLPDGQSSFLPTQGRLHTAEQSYSWLTSLWESRDHGITEV